MNKRYVVCDKCHKVYWQRGMANICQNCETGNVHEISKDIADIILDIKSEDEWIRIQDELPKVIITNGECNMVLTKRAEEPDCGSFYQVDNTLYINKHPEKYTHWKNIIPPEDK